MLITYIVKTFSPIQPNCTLVHQTGKSPLHHSEDRGNFSEEKAKKQPIFFIFCIILCFFLWAFTDTSKAEPILDSITIDTATTYMPYHTDVYNLKSIEHIDINALTSHGAALQGYIDPVTGRPTAPLKNHDLNTTSPRSLLQTQSTPLTYDNVETLGGGKFIVLGTDALRSNMQASLKNKHAIAQCKISSKHAH